MKDLYSTDPTQETPCRLNGSHPATRSRSGIDLSALKYVDHEVELDHTDHTDHLSEVTRD